MLMHSSLKTAAWEKESVVTQQRCQLAEVSAAKLKRGRKTICAAEQIGGRNFVKYSPKRAEHFF